MKSYRFLDHDDAYAEFKKLFADQPVLVENDDARRACPTSFRVVPMTPQLTQHDRATSSRTCPASTQINTPAKDR